MNTNYKAGLLALAAASLSACTSTQTRTPTENPVQPFAAADAIGNAPLGSTISLSGDTSQSIRVISEYAAASGKLCRKFVGSSTTSGVACKNADGRWYLQRDLSPGSLQSNRTSSDSAGFAAPVEVPIASESAVESEQATPPREGNVLVLASGRSPAMAIPKAVESPGLELESLPAKQVSRRAISVKQASDVIGEIHALRDGETLWSFAVRQTGNGLNWTAIAEQNGIKHVNELKPGLDLIVPSALLLK